MKCALIQLPLLLGSVLSVVATSDALPGKPGAKEWIDMLKRAEVVEVTADAVTFAQPENGKIRISRKTGMLIRQEITGVDGEARMLDLTNRPDLWDKFSERAVGGPLEAEDDGTEKARDQVAAMLNTAYCTAMLENRMKKFWPPPEEEPAAAGEPAKAP
jgi:hypothetical protein